MRSRANQNFQRIIYISTPVSFDDSVIEQILNTSKQNNAQSRITGALIYRQDFYLQFLEGPRDQIIKTYERILQDKRHCEIVKLREDETHRKMFSSWAMRGDAAKTWMWSYEDVKSGVLRKLSSDKALDVFIKVSRDIDQFN